MTFTEHMQVLKEDIRSKPQEIKEFFEGLSEYIQYNMWDDTKEGAMMALKVIIWIPIIIIGSIIVFGCALMMVVLCIMAIGSLLDVIGSIFGRNRD